MRSYTRMGLCLAGAFFLLCGCSRRDMSELTLPQAADALEEALEQEPQEQPKQEEPKQEQPEQEDRDEKEQEPTSQEQSKETPEEQKLETLDFSQLKIIEFLCTDVGDSAELRLYVEEDGSFRGIYQDTGSDKGKEQDYAEFTGWLGQAVPQGAQLWQVTVEELSYENAPGTQKTKNQIRYHYTEAPGLAQGVAALLYGPGYALEGLPQAYRAEVEPQLSQDSVKELPFWGIYLEEESRGFVGVDLLGQEQELVELTRKEAAQLSARIAEASAQQDMNRLSTQLYEKWDERLNELWNTLKRVMEPDAMAALTREEKVWIEEKEQAAKKAGAGAKNGTLRPLLENTKAAELTEKRVYELMELLEQQ